MERKVYFDGSGEEVMGVRLPSQKHRARLTCAFGTFWDVTCTMFFNQIILFIVSAMSTTGKRSNTISSS